EVVRLRIPVFGAVVFSADGRLILTGDRHGNMARLLDADTGTEVKTLKGHTGAVLAVAFSRDGRTVLTGSADRTARLWEAATGKELQVFRGHSVPVTAIAFSPGAQHILTGGLDGYAKVWDLAPTREEVSLHTGLLWSHAVFSPDGNRVATWGMGRAAQIWDAVRGVALARLEHATIQGVQSLAFSPTGERVVTITG